MPSPVLVFLGFAAYAGLHSFLLTTAARAAMEALVGPRVFQGVFRLGFSLQATVLLAAYVVWVAHLPDVMWAEAPGTLAGVLWAFRLGAFGFILFCVRRVGGGEFVGWTQFQEWRRGKTVIGDGVETGDLVVTGPYRSVRHPMYSALLVALWAEPEWSANRAAFILAATLYLWLGSLHEERRLLRYYGASYRRYQALTPRFIPRFPRGQKNR